MNSLPILQKGHIALSTVCQPVVFPDLDLAHQLTQMHATLADFRSQKGFGRAMAASQVGLNKRIIVMNLGASAFAVINPSITWRSQDMQTVWDDCLSVADCVVRVQRHSSVSVTYQDEQGRVRHWQELPADLAELLQHEIDHVDGILMTDRVLQASDIRPIADHASLIISSRPQTSSFA
jgi:peptide deformylase